MALSASAQTTDPATGREPTPLQRGEALFTGKSPLQGKPRDHLDFLPPQVVRCANCHVTDNSSGKRNLDGVMLTVLRPRRGGPPSAYDPTTFCKLLSTGIDPAYVMIDHAMPIYSLANADCAALWTYITRLETMP